MTVLTRLSLWVALVVGCVVAAGTQPVVAAEQTFITIGTGGVTGVYYPAGSAICRLVNKSRKEHGIRCSVESTGGSIFNLNALRAGELDFGIAQSDWQYHAFTGSSKFSDQGAYGDLRSVLSLYPEPFTIVANKNSGITSVADLKGKRVNIGNPGSGARATMEVLMNAMGWTLSDFSVVSELATAEQSQALCDNKVDAIVFTVGHPSGTIKEATSTCESTLVSIDDATISTLLKDNPYYSRTVIPGGMYDGTDADTVTFGVRATLVVAASTADNMVHEVVKAVFENFSDFKKLHPAFAGLDKTEMVRASLSAPLHPGAEKFFREAGLLK